MTSLLVTTFFLGIVLFTVAEEPSGVHAALPAGVLPVRFLPEVVFKTSLEACSHISSDPGFDHRLPGYPKRLGRCDIAPREDPSLFLHEQAPYCAPEGCALLRGCRR